MTDHSGVITIARNGVDEVIRLNRVVAELGNLLQETRDCVLGELNHAEVSGRLRRWRRRRGCRRLYTSMLTVGSVTACRATAPPSISACCPTGTD